MKLRQLRLPFRLSDEPYVVVDVETTGLDPDIDRVVEVAAVRFEAGRVVDRFESLVDPGREIPPEASEIHHLVDADVIDALPMEGVEPLLDAFVGDDIVFAHNADFDRGFLPILHDRTWVCSARAARHAWPDAKRHRNQYLRYWLRLDTPELRKTAAHRAGGDALVTGLVVHEELKAFEISYPDAGLADFLRHVAEPIPIRILRFGKKHYGKLMEDVPVDYFRWMLREVPDLDADLRAAILEEIERRAGTSSDVAA